MSTSGGSAASTLIDRATLGDRLAALDPVAAADPSTIRAVRAPGRVNLIGEHTDYNDGFVLPAAIDLEIRIAYRPTDDRRVVLASDADPILAEIDLEAPPPPRGDWTDYVTGTALAMRAAGLPVTGFRGVLASTVPVGAGLSSSAALELAVAWALSGEAPPRIAPLDLARIAQRAENEHVGVRCGLMDQFASASGRPGAAVLLDCRTLASRPVPLPDGLVLVVAHTGLPRALGASAYNERRAQCEAAVATLARYRPGIGALRDVDEALLDAHAATLDPIVLKRARHVVRENARVLAAERALGERDLGTVARLFAESHASLRDDYEVSCPELDLLVEIAAGSPGVHGSRMTGAGFGGCTVTLAEAGAVDALRMRILGEYADRSGREPRVWTVDAVAGAGELA